MPEASERVAFFRHCIQQEQAEVEEGRAFYFRLDDIPAEIRAMWSRSLDSAEWAPWWPEYLTLKYRALAIVNRTPRVRLPTLLRRLEIPEVYGDIVQAWKGLAAVERRVFQLRLRQIGDMDIVHHTWYDEFPSFSDWAASCAEGAGVPVPAAERMGDIATLLRNRATSDLHSEDAEGGFLVEVLSDVREQSGDLRGGADAEDVFIGAGGTASISVDPVALQVAKAMLSMRADGNLSLSDHIDVLIAIVMRQFNARAVDFLVLRHYPGREQLELLSTSANAQLSEAKRKQLETQDAYARPTGITGSVLVARRGNPLFHVGTNDLASDPRQSPSHRSAYADLYGELVNFWTFPVFVRDQLLGALRVVNRVDADDRVVPWPYLVRRRIAGLMQSVGVFLDGCTEPRLAERSRELRAPSLVVAAGQSVAASRLALTELVAREGVPLKVEILAAMLDVLANWAELRVEDRGVAITAVVVDSDRAIAARDIVHGTRFVPVYDPPTLADLMRWSSRHGETVLVLTQEGLLLGLVEGADRALTESHRLSVQHGIDAVLTQSFPGSERCIAIWFRGAHIADYAYIPRLGSWRLRDLTKGLDTLASKFTTVKATLELAFREAVTLSYAHGSTIVLMHTADAPARFPFSRTGEAPQQLLLLDQVSSRLVELAHNDGAIIVSLAGKIESFKETLPNARPVKVSAGIAHALGNSQSRLRRSERGTKHQSALVASAHYPQSVILCVSENRTLCAFSAGDILVWDF